MARKYRYDSKLIFFANKDFSNVKIDLYIRRVEKNTDECRFYMIIILLKNVFYNMNEVNGSNTMEVRYI